MSYALGASRFLGSVVCAAVILTACSAESDSGSSSKGNGPASFGNADDGFGNTTGGAGSGSTGVLPGGGTGCASAMVRGARVTPTIWLVIDGSGSMDEAFGASTRWNELRAALMDPAGGVVPTLQAAVLWGMVMYDCPIDFGAIFGGLFGGGGTDAGTATGMCPRLVKVDPALNNYNAINDPANYPAMPLGGSTPTHNALDAVLPFVATPPQTPDGTVSPIYVVLATDGQPNDFCSGGIGADASALVLTAAQKIADTGTKMYVISLAGGDAALQAHLEQVAMIGGTGKPPFTPMNKADLLQTFQEIIGGAVGCEIRLNGKVTPGQECAGYVNIKGIGQLTCNDPNGWRLKDEQTIEITGTACEKFRATKDASLDANFPCDVFTPE